MRRAITVIPFTLVLLLLLEIGLVAAVPLETTISQRYSVRTYTSQSLTSQQLLDLLRLTCGFEGSNRVLPKIGDDYSIIVFAVNASGSFRYIPETNSLSVWDTAINIGTISSNLLQSWQKDANVVLVFVWDQTKVSNEYFGSAEAGLLVQNCYLAAVNLGIGTCCASSIDPVGLQSALNLPTSMRPLLVMPVGFPTSPYPTATPDYSRMTGNLPQVQNSEKSFADALSSLNLTRDWSTQELSSQELSQVLWAAYGYSSVGHRTTPSFGGWYPLIVYALNASGAFQYLPETHSVMQIQVGDKRSSVAVACGNQVWAADAATIFLVAYNSSGNVAHYPDPGWYDFWIEVDAGCVCQQILLESSTLSLSANVIVNGFESWNGTSAQTVRDILGIIPSIVPLCILPVSHVSTSSSPTPTPSLSPSSSPTLPPEIPEFYSPFVMIGIIVVASVGILILKKKFAWNRL